MSVLEYQGWEIYHNTGWAHRSWKFAKPHEAMQAEPGHHLFDNGPDAKVRFQVRDPKDDWKTLHKPDEEAVRELLGRLPPWSPPPEANAELRELAKHAKGLKQEILSLRMMMMGFGTKNSEPTSSGAAAEKSNEGGAAEASEQENDHLRLVRTGEYSNTGEGFRVWELKQDVPEIPVFHTRGVKGKPYAQAGDELWEELDDDDLTPFKLKRGGRRIGSPEWWMVRHLFEGLDVWGEGRSGSEEDGSSGKRRPPSRLYYSGEIKQWDRQGAYVFREAVAEIGAEAGDVLIYACCKGWRPKEIYGQVRGLTLEDYAALRELVEEKHGTLRAGLPKLIYNLSGPQGEEMCMETGTCYDGTPWKSKTGVHAFLADRRRWGSRLKKFYSRLLLVKPWRRSVSEPIRAKSDDGAIFELLSEIGCRPPEEKS